MAKSPPIIIVLVCTSGGFVILAAIVAAYNHVFSLHSFADIFLDAQFLGATATALVMCYAVIQQYWRLLYFSSAILWMAIAVGYEGRRMLFYVALAALSVFEGLRRLSTSR